MLDLQTLLANRYEIKTEDGEVIHLRRPSQKAMSSIFRVEAANYDGDTAMKEVSEFVHAILNNNDEGKTFTKKYVADMDYGIQVAIMMDYAKWVKDGLGE